MVLGWVGIFVSIFWLIHDKEKGGASFPSPLASFGPNCSCSIFSFPKSTVCDRGSRLISRDESTLPRCYVTNPSSPSPALLPSQHSITWPMGTFLCLYPLFHSIGSSSNSLPASTPSVFVSPAAHSEYLNYAPSLLSDSLIK